MKFFFGLFSAALLVGYVSGDCSSARSQLSCVKLLEESLRQGGAEGIEKPPICGDGETATCSDITRGEKTFSCPSCYTGSVVGEILADTCKLREFETCSSDASPEMVHSAADGLCPSCKPPVRDQEDKQTCTKATYTACKEAMADAAACTEETPSFNRETCCISCKPPARDCAEKDIKCATDASQLPACNMDKSEVRLSTSGDLPCCRSCMPKGIKDKMDASGTRKWTKDEFKDAIRQVPECESGEKASRDKKLPGPSCKRPQSKKTLKEVVECLKDKQRCESFDEFRDVMPGQTCPACKPPRPSCTPACGENEKCIPTRGETRGNRTQTRGTKCAGKRRFRLRVKAKKKMKQLKKRMEGMDKEEFVSLLEEVVARFCERTEDKVAKFCDKNLEAILASLECKEFKNKKGSIDVQIEVADDEDDDELAGTRRLLAGEGTEELFNNALADSDEVEQDADGSPSTQLVATWGVTCLSVVAASFML